MTATMHAHAAKADEVSNKATPTKKPEIWWSNAIFFVGFHVMSLIGAVFLSPPSQVPWQTWVLCFISWQLASFGITIGEKGSLRNRWADRAPCVWTLID